MTIGQTCGRPPEHVQTPGLFDHLVKPLSELEEAVLREFAGQVMRAGDVHMQHGLDSRYTEQNYKTVLKRLEHEGRVQCNPSANQRKANTMKDETLVKFPLPPS